MIRSSSDKARHKDRSGESADRDSLLQPAGRGEVLEYDHTLSLWPADVQ